MNILWNYVLIACVEIGLSLSLLLFEAKSIVSKRFITLLSIKLYSHLFTIGIRINRLLSSLSVQNYAGNWNIPTVGFRLQAE